MIIKPEIPEPFTALGILNEECRIGDYPSKVYPNEWLQLCLFLYNHKTYPILARVKYKIGTNDTLPSNTTASPLSEVAIYDFLLGVKENVTQIINVPILIDSENKTRVALIFELWIFDIEKREWVYTGIWNHLYVDVVKVPLP